MIKRVVLASLFLCELVPVFARANSGDFSGGVAIGTTFAGHRAAPTNGLIVEGPVSIGTSISNTGLTITANSGAPPLFSSTSLVQLVGTNGSVVTLEGNAYGGSFALEGVRYDGTFSGPSALLSGDIITSFSAVGYNGSTLSANEATVAIFAGGNWSPTSEPTFIILGTTPSGSTSRVERMRVDSTGNVGIGSTVPIATLDINGTLRVASFASGSSTTVCQNGNVLSSCTSALRFKENVRPYAMGLKEVMEMKPVTFDQRDHADGWEKHDFGFIAEDMEKINPTFVTYDSDGKLNGVRYMQMTAVNTKAIQEMQSEIDDLKRAIEELKHQQ